MTVNMHSFLMRESHFFIHYKYAAFSLYQQIVSLFFLLQSAVLAFTNLETSVWQPARFSIMATSRLCCPVKVIQTGQLLAATSATLHVTSAKDPGVSTALSAVQVIS